MPPPRGRRRRCPAAPPARRSDGDSRQSPRRPVVLAHRVMFGADDEAGLLEPGVRERGEAIVEEGAPDRDHSLHPPGGCRLLGGVQRRVRLGLPHPAAEPAGQDDGAVHSARPGPPHMAGSRRASHHDDTMNTAMNTSPCVVGRRAGSPCRRGRSTPRCSRGPIRGTPSAGCRETLAPRPPPGPPPSGAGRPDEPEEGQQGASLRGGGEQRDGDPDQRGDADAQEELDGRVHGSAGLLGHEESRRSRKEQIIALISLQALIRHQNQRSR